MTVNDDWNDETTDQAQIEVLTKRKPQHRRACLTVLTGSRSGHMVTMREDRVIIGRAPQAELRLEDDGISRHHADITSATGRAWIEDLGSRNGTFVNGDRISDKVELKDGDKIQVGRGTVLRFGFQDALDESFHASLLSSALRDSLTKLFNRRYFLERLDSELKFAQRHDTSVSLLLFDIDRFKTVNDQHGHLAGDAVLTKVAEVVIAAVRNEDVVARFGGDEFAIVLRSIDIDSATHTAERLRKLVEAARPTFGAAQLSTTVSFGVANYPVIRATTPEELIDAADKALYQAKRGGRNRVGRA